jgi:hypothetical protein
MAVLPTRRELLPLLLSLPATARAAVDRLLTGKETPADRFWANPCRLMTDAGMTPDAWQRQLLMHEFHRTLLLCSRQAGKSQVAAALALGRALLEPGSLILLLSRAERQATELLRKVLDLYLALGRPVPCVRDSATRLELANGSRIESLPGSEGTVRCYSSVRLLVIDEAARVPDSLYGAVRPMLAVSHGGLIALSSAWAKQGWFYEAWVSTKREWHKVRVPATECPRISAAFLEEEREALGPRYFALEYMCEFGDTVEALFSEEQVRRALTNDVQPLFMGE